MRKLEPIAAIVLIAFSIAVLSTSSCHRRTSCPVETVQKDTVPILGFFEDSLDMITGEVRSGETFTDLMTRLGMSSQDAWMLAQKCDTVFDVRKLRAGNPFSAYYDADTVSVRHLEYVVYKADRVHLTVFHCADSLAVWNVVKPVETRQQYADFTINTSLWNDMTAAGASPLLISSLSEIYAWTVDFFGLQKGDRFRILYSDSWCDGELFSVDTIYYAVYTREGHDQPAIMYDQGDGGNLYWNEKGESLRKAFLKAPLKFTRISSTFSYHRHHPITGQVRAHTAVDYAAPTGTPVMSIGDGTVISAGWGGGGGNTVKIRHNSMYTTAYLHLSRYAKGIKAGTRVKQGDVIGYVGSTGMSTGPHLDFRVWKNGTPVDPLKLESPNEDPIREENLPALDSVYRLYKARVDSLSR